MLRKEQLKVSSEIIDVIFKCVDSLQEMVENIGNGESEDLVDVSDLVRKVNAIAKGDAAPAAEEAEEAAEGENAAAPVLELNDTDETVIREAKNSGLIPYAVHVEIAESCLLKSARSYMVMNVLDELGDVIKSVPPAQDLEQEKFDHSFDVVIVTDAEPKAIEDGVSAISEITEVKVTEITLSASKEETKEEAPKAAAPAAKKAEPKK